MNRTERLKADGHELFEPILFYHPWSDWGVFSNFSGHSIELLNPWTNRLYTYQTGEHRFQAMKAINEEDHDFVAETGSPSDAKITGRSIKLREDWGDNINSVCWYVMSELVTAKTIQHRPVARILSETFDAPIYEDSEFDDIWGWRYKRSYTGKNLLGRCWMQTRELLLSPAR